MATKKVSKKKPTVKALGGQFAGQLAVQEWLEANAYSEDLESSLKESRIALDNLLSEAEKFMSDKALKHLKAVLTLVVENITDILK